MYNEHASQNKMRLFAVLLPFWWLFSCKSTETPIVSPPLAEPEKIDLLCLGDSYTKGQGVSLAGSFPFQMADSLRLSGYEVLNGAPHVIAQTGWRTDQLLAAMADDSAIIDSVFEVITVCIGVNNQFQNKPIAVYATEFEQVLKQAIDCAGQRPERVFVLSIPDWAYTTYGQQFSNTNISAKIDAFNAVNLDISTRFAVNYINVTPISRQGIAQPSLVATDGLHPSAAQYSNWLGLLLPSVKAQLD